MNETPGGEASPQIDLEKILSDMHTHAVSLLEEPEAGTIVPDSWRDLSHEQELMFFNRELSWLDFNWRVFYQSLDNQWPILERVRFLGITSNNLDEFFRKRVGGLKRQLAAGTVKKSPDGMSPADQLVLVNKAARKQYHALTKVWEDDLRIALSEVGVVVREFDSLSDDQKKVLKEQFMSEVFPILTPLIVDPGHPFPFISNLSLSLAFALKDPVINSVHFARLKVPNQVERWIPVPGEVLNYLPAEQLISNFAGELFKGLDIISVDAFRITRNADIRRNEEEADDLLAMISEEVRERRFAKTVRLEVHAEMPESTRRLLKEELGLDSDDVYLSDGMLDLSALMDLANVDLPDHKSPVWEPIIPRRLSREKAGVGQNIFQIIRREPLFMHHPYDSFTASTLRFLEDAGNDDKVIAIKMTLYRTSKDSEVIQALINAAEKGKHVAVMVEVKARFDEEQNILWARELSKVGIHVTYGIVGLKTHTKTAIVIRQDEDGLRTYSHIATGNYNPKTAKLYTDFGLLSCDPVLGRDLVNLFHSLTGHAPKQTYEKIIVAPNYLRDHFVTKIRAEIANQKEYGKAWIIAKMNGLDDPDIILELYKASQAGVKVDLVVRGHCRLRPGVRGFSENIRVVSIIGRFLEHSRIYFFHNNGDPEIFLGSADWQTRNLDDRVEAIFPVEEPTHKSRVLKVLKYTLSDNRLAWDLGKEGCYRRRNPGPQDVTIELHDTLYRDTIRREAEPIA